MYRLSQCGLCRENSLRFSRHSDSRLQNLQIFSDLSKSCRGDYVFQLIPFGIYRTTFLPWSATLGKFRVTARAFLKPLVFHPITAIVSDTSSHYLVHFVALILLFCRLLQNSAPYFRLIQIFRRSILR